MRYAEIGIAGWFVGLLILLVSVAAGKALPFASAGLTLMLAGVFPGLVELPAQAAERPMPLGRRGSGRSPLRLLPPPDPQQDRRAKPLSTVPAARA